MSDTDDTDLLLLIPPDFFLVRTPDFDSDCDISFSFDHDEVKDSIVSDLITQVNDLESRICLIEHLDRSITCCSSHIEDSFTNQQSLNSLTESDILRAQIESNSKKLALVSNNNHMLESAEGIENDSKLSIERHIVDSNSISDNLPINSANQQSRFNVNVKIAGIKCTNDNIENQGLLDQETERIEAQCHNDKKELIDEVDCFLEIKNKASFRQTGVNNSSKEPVQLSFNNESGLQQNSSKPELKSNDDKSYVEGSYQKHSLALPEVFELLKEMEETQHEIEKKLKYREPDFQTEKTNNSTLLLKKSEDKIISSQLLDLEVLNSNKPTINSLLNKQTENIHERLKSITESKYQGPDRYRLGNSLNKQVGHLFKPNVYDESSLKTDSKSLSLTCSPAEVIMTNFPSKNGRSSKSHAANSKECPVKYSGFKRSLNFEDVDTSRNQIKSTTIPYLIDEENNDSLEIHSKNGKLSDKFPSSSTSRQSVYVDGKHNYVTSQKTKVSEGKHNEIVNTEINPRGSAVLQHKIRYICILCINIK